MTTGKVDWNEKEGAKERRMRQKEKKGIGRAESKGDAGRTEGGGVGRGGGRTEGG